jgi:hypothetical protein
MTKFIYTTSRDSLTRAVVDGNTSPMDNAELMARLERLETIEESRRASNRYALAVDTQDFDLMEKVFTTDAQLHLAGGREFAGRQAVVDFYRGRLDPSQKQKHFIVNNDVTWISPGHAEMTSYLLFTGSGPDKSTLGWGTYIDRIEVIDGVGYIAEKTIIISTTADSREGWATS